MHGEHLQLDRYKMSKIFLDTLARCCHYKTVFLKLEFEDIFLGVCKLFFKIRITILKFSQ